MFLNGKINNIDFDVDFQPGNTQNEKLLKAQFKDGGYEDCIWFKVVGGSV